MQFLCEPSSDSVVGGKSLSVNLTPDSITWRTSASLVVNSQVGNLNWSVSSFWVGMASRSMPLLKTNSRGLMCEAEAL